MGVHLAHIDIAHKHAAAVDVPKARNQTCGRCLPPTRRTDQRNRRTRWHLKTHLVKCRNQSPIIGKAHSLEAIELFAGCGSAGAEKTGAASTSSTRPVASAAS